MAKDRVTIGLTNNGKAFMDMLLTTGWFSQDMDAAKFALAYAVSKKVPAGEAKGVSTVWNVGSIDPDQSVVTILSEFYQEKETPYKLAEYLVDEGLKLIVEQIQKNPAISLSELLSN